MSLLSTSTPSSRRKSSIHRMKSQLTQVLADDAVARKALTPLADCNSPVAESPHHAVVKSPTRQQQAMNTPAFVEHATPAPEAAETTADFLARLTSELEALHVEAPHSLKDRLLCLRDDAVRLRSRLDVDENEYEPAPDMALEAPMLDLSDASGLIQPSTPPPVLSRQPSSRSPATPTYGDNAFYASRLQSRWRANRLRSSSIGASVIRLRSRGRAAYELHTSESKYNDSLNLLLTGFFAPLQRHGVPNKRLATLFGNLQVLANLSRMMLAQLTAAADTAAAPSAAVATTLLRLLPSYKCYNLYVSGLSAAQQMFTTLREEDPEADALITAAESTANASLTSLLVAPARRLPNYALYIERMLQLTPLDATERTSFCRALGAVNEICAVVDASLADHEGRQRVSEMAQAIGQETLRSHPQLISTDGLVAPHRRFVFEGPLLELPIDDPRGKGIWRHAVLFNDMLLVLNAKPSTSSPTATTNGEKVPKVSLVDCISLAKVQVKHLPQDNNKPGTQQRARCSFELWSMARIWRYAAPNESERVRWVEKVQAQVRFLLASFKQRGKSLAFLPQNVQLLRAQLAALTHERQSVEQRVLELTAGMCQLDEEVVEERGRMVKLQRMTRRSLVGASGAQLTSQLDELKRLKESVEGANERRVAMQRETDQCVEKLYELCNALEATDGQHNDDSLLQFMLFSS